MSKKIVKNAKHTIQIVFAGFKGDLSGGGAKQQRQGQGGEQVEEVEQAGSQVLIVPWCSLNL